MMHAPEGRRFRFSYLDLAAIILAGLATWVLWTFIGSFALIVPVTLGHFFLFCNVFRVRRSYELLWSVCFVGNLAYWLSFPELNWLGVLAVQSPLTIGLIALELRSQRATKRLENSN